MLFIRTSVLMMIMVTMLVLMFSISLSKKIPSLWKEFPIWMWV